jgi:hypothetical protein
VRHGGLTPGLTLAQQVVERWRDGGEGSGGGAFGTGSLGARREGKEGRGRGGEEGVLGHPFIGLEGSGVVGWGGESGV